MSTGSCTIKVTDDWGASNHGLSLLTLPPELILMILCQSIEPNLIHVCRQLRNTLPPFVQWTKSVVGIAMCLTETGTGNSASYPQYRQLMQQFTNQCGIKPLTSSRKDEIRANLLASNWFRPEHFLKVLSELYDSMHEDLIEYWAQRSLGTLMVSPLQAQQASQKFVRLGQGQMYLVRLSGLCFAVRTISAHYPAYFSIWKYHSGQYEPTVMHEVRCTSGRMWKREGTVLTFIWGFDFTVATEPDISDLRDILVYFILQKNVESVKEILERLSSLNSPGGVEWAHVVLAARLGYSEILKVLVFQDIWPAWPAANVRWLADAMKQEKGQSWKAVYQLLHYEWKMQQARNQYRAQKCLAASDL